MMNPRIKKVVKWFVLIAMTLCAVVYIGLFLRHKADDAFFAKEAKNWTQETFKFSVYLSGRDIDVRYFDGVVGPDDLAHAEVLAYLSDPRTRDGWFAPAGYVPDVRILLPDMTINLFENFVVVGTRRGDSGGWQVSRRATEQDRRIRALILSLDAKPSLGYIPYETEDQPDVPEPLDKP